MSSSSSSSCRAHSTYISMTISRQPSLSFIVPERSYAQHPVSSHSWSMWVLGGRPTLACSCVGFYRRTSLMSSSLFLQQCPACLVRITHMVYKMGGKWPYSSFLVGCCFHDLFKTACSILVQLPFNLFSRCFIRVQVAPTIASHN